MTTLTPVYFIETNSNSPIQNDDEIGDACIPNISPQERKKRVQFVVTLVVLVVLVALNINPLWRLLLFFMFSAATTSYIQALDKT
jgi:hypothetical protein